MIIPKLGDIVLLNTAKGQIPALVVGVDTSTVNLRGFPDGHDAPTWVQHSMQGNKIGDWQWQDIPIKE